MKKISFSEAVLKKAAAQSSKMEGVSFFRARKNKMVIAKLKRYGRAIAV